MYRARRIASFAIWYTGDLCDAIYVPACHVVCKAEMWVREGGRWTVVDGGSRLELEWGAGLQKKMGRDVTGFFLFFFWRKSRRELGRGRIRKTVQTVLTETALMHHAITN